MEQSRLAIALQRASQNDREIKALYVLTEQIYTECIHLLEKIYLYMRQYTDHGRVHVDNVIDIIGRLLPDSTFAQLTPLELATMILAATLHDIGMTASVEEVEKMRNEGPGGSITNYQSFREGYPRILRRMEQLRKTGNYTLADDMESYLTSEYLRREHGNRCRQFIFDHLKERLVYAGNNFSVRLAEVCFSHTRPPIELENLPCWELVRTGGERCNWRFVAIMLRLADILDFDAKRTPMVLFHHLGIRDTVSLKEWGKHLAVNAWDITPGRIAFNAKCPDPVIQKTTYDFIDWIDYELLEAHSILTRMHSPDNHNLHNRYFLDLPRRVNRDEIGPQEDSKGPIYKFVDLSFTLEKEQIISLVLGVHLYADRSLFLRELFQNAIDACRYRQAIFKQKPELGKYEPEIIVRLFYDGIHYFVEVEDNGVGMDEWLISNYFARIGRSYYTSHEFIETRTKQGLDFQAISHFGIGILSVFMAGDQLKIDTLCYKNMAVPVAVEITDEGSLFWFNFGTKHTIGTKVTLRLTQPIDDLFPIKKWLYKKDESITNLKRLFDTVQRLVIHTDIPIFVRDEKESCSIDSIFKFPEDNNRLAQIPVTEININLTLRAPKGLDGIIRIFLLTSPSSGKFVSEIKGIEKDEDTHLDYIHVIFPDVCGFIRTEITTTLKSGNTEEVSSMDVNSGGRWSQQGILVDCPIFPQYDYYGRRKKPITIPFPFPIEYDIDLSGEFVLPLSADRNNVLPSDDTNQVCKKIALIIIELMFQELGTKRVRANRKFFEKIFKKRGDENALNLLKNFVMIKK
ncbi:MAG: Chaperone protein HtpG [bacterium]|nr:Chaperone protein HtpG [bacterium]